jgi:hypothetical protein
VTEEQQHAIERYNFIIKEMEHAARGEEFRAYKMEQIGRLTHAALLRREAAAFWNKAHQWKVLRDLIDTTDAPDPDAYLGD